MKYVFFVTRDPWASFNSIYAYIKIKNVKPSKFLALYTDEKNMKSVHHMLSTLYEKIGKDFEMMKIKIDSDDIEEHRRILADHLEEGDIVDITGARKIMILALSGIKGVKIVYLYLRDMRFSSHPFMMRPMSVQSFAEVEV